MARINIYFTDGTLRRLRYYIFKKHGKHNAMSLTVQRAIDDFLGHELTHCEECKEPIHFGDKTGAILHHVIPIDKGGPDEADNLMLLCRRCHNSIHDIPGKLKKGRETLGKEDDV